MAPWAVNVTTKSKQFVHNRNAKPFQPMIECGQTNGSDFDGFELMEGYIKRCLPDSTSLDAEQQRAEDWNSQQAAATPTLLPTLKFHDLVFGAVLGEGAFSVVKYARRITKVGNILFIRHCSRNLVSILHRIRPNLVGQSMQ